MERIATKVREQQPDLVLLQEVWLGAYVRSLSRALAGDYEIIYRARPLTRRPRGGLVVFLRRRSGWVAESATFEMYPSSAPGWRVWEGDGISGKGLLALRFRRDDETLGIVNTHLQAQYPHSGRLYPEVRSSQLRMLNDFVAREYRDVPLLIAGDLNTAPAEGLYASQIAALGTDLTVNVRRECASGTHIDARSGASDWIDYVIARNVTVDAAVLRIVNDAADSPFSAPHGLLVRLTYQGNQPR